MSYQKIEWAEYTADGGLDAGWVWWRKRVLRRPEPRQFDWNPDAASSVPTTCRKYAAR